MELIKPLGSLQSRVHKRLRLNLISIPIRQNLISFSERKKVKKPEPESEMFQNIPPTDFSSYLQNIINDSNIDPVTINKKRWIKCVFKSLYVNNLITNEQLLDFKTDLICYTTESISGLPLLSFTKKVTMNDYYAI